jgi:TonB family protein
MMKNAIAPIASTRLKVCAFVIIQIILVSSYNYATAQDDKYKLREIWADTTDRVFTKVDVQPEYPGGYNNMMKFIRKNMTYPADAIKDKIEGTVYVQFIVEKDGSVSSVNTIRGISRSCDLEAERVVASMPKWTPGKKDGENVAVRFVLPFAFKGNFTKEKSKRN